MTGQGTGVGLVAVNFLAQQYATLFERFSNGSHSQRQVF